MSGADYLADTNCFIYLLEGHQIVTPFIADLWAYSFITSMELLSKFGCTAEEESVITLALDNCILLDEVRPIMKAAIDMRKKYRLKLPDAIIAGTAHVYQLPLLTADKHFGSISEIDCFLLQF